MKQSKLTAVLLAALVCLAVSAIDVRAQARARAGGRAPGGTVGRAVPRVGGVRPIVIYPRVVGRVPYRPYYYPYRPILTIGFYAGHGYGYPYGYPYYYGYPYAYSGYGYPGYAYPPPPPAYVNATPGVAYGGVRIHGAPRDAQVFVDGYYVGIVDDFDGAGQHLNLQAGPHQIEIHAQGQPPIAFDVNIQPGQTITYHAAVQ